MVQCIELRQSTGDTDGPNHVERHRLSQFGGSSPVPAQELTKSPHARGQLPETSGQMTAPEAGITSGADNARAKLSSWRRGNRMGERSAPPIRHRVVKCWRIPRERALVKRIDIAA